MIRKPVDGMMLATLREKARLRQVDLAELVGCSQPYLSKLERSKLERSSYGASLSLIEQIAHVLSDRLDQPITAEALTTPPDVCPTCHTPLAQTA